MLDEDAIGSTRARRNGHRSLTNEVTRLRIEADQDIAYDINRRISVCAYFLRKQSWRNQFSSMHTKQLDNSFHKNQYTADPEYRQKTI